MPELLNIGLNKIRANPVALRDVNRESEEFIGMVDSIRKEGVFNAIVVRRKSGEDGKEFELVDGLQRFTASQEAGRTEIPAQVIEKEDADALLTQIIGNAHRIQTRPVEYARAIVRILAYNPTWTEAQLAAKLFKSPTWINQQLGLLKLHDQIRPLVNEGKIPLSNAYVLAKLPPEEQLNWIERAQTEESAKFGPAALERVKSIRDAHRQGRDAEAEEFKPVKHLRKKPEIEAELDSPQIGPTLIKESNLVAGAKSKEEAALKGFQLGLQWALNFDPKSIALQKAKDDERRKHDDEARIRRDAEKKGKRADELKEKETQARKDAEDAKTAAAKLPV